MPRRLPPYLELRPTGFYFRRIIRLEPSSGPSEPAPNQPLESKNAPEGEDKPAKTARSTFNLSLSTRNEALARRITRRLTSVSDLLLEFRTESGMSLSPNIMLEVLRQVRSFELAAYDRRRASQGQRTLADVEAAISREHAIQDVLRRALTVNDGSHAVGPTRRAMEALGLTEPNSEEDPDWQTLMFHSTRVLLDVSEDRALREGGTYRSDSPVLAEIAASLGCDPRGSRSPIFASVRTGVLPFDAFAANLPTDTQTLAERTHPAVLENTAPNHAQPLQTPGLEAQKVRQRPEAVATDLVISEASQPAVSEAGPAATAVVHNAPAKPKSELTKPAKNVSVAAQGQPSVSDAKEQDHEPFDLNKLRIDATVLSGPIRDAIRFPQKLTVDDAFQLKEELLLAGYPDAFSGTPKRVERKEEGPPSTLPGLHVARKIAVDFFGSQPIVTITPKQVQDFLIALAKIPHMHAKNKANSTASGFAALIKKCDEKEAKSIAEAKALIASVPHMCEEDKDMLLSAARIRRISAETFLKHGRKLGGVGRMLEELGLHSRNYFFLCKWTSKEEKALKATETRAKREPWDDTIHKLLASPTYQGECDGVDDPLFWAPLISWHSGMRMEEILQLREDDFGTEGGVAYMRVRDGDGNIVKSAAAERRIPIHSNLITLGLLELVNFRRKSGRGRLFQGIARGENKGKFSENFSKKFTRLRQDCDVYKETMDFHSFRTTFHGFLLNASTVSDARRRRLMGHEPVDEGEKSYAQALSMVALKADIENVKLDISKIISPFAKAETVALPAPHELKPTVATGVRVH